MFESTRPEVLLAGPMGTGKSRCCLEKLHIFADNIPNSRYLICRKTRESLTETALLTFEKRVVPDNHPILTPIQRNNRQNYHYPNGSEIVVGGLDKSTKIMSGDFDLIFVQEATELFENEWEDLTTRLRTGKVVIQQLIADANPGPPTHWLKVRCDRGQTELIESRHEDNPELFNHRTNTWTKKGAEYIAKLDALTGVRRLRNRLGIWAAAEGLVYEGYDPAVHQVTLEQLRTWQLVEGYHVPAA